MSIRELKFGESAWFRMRNGQIAFACRVNSSGCYQFAGSFGESIESWLLSGMYSQHSDDSPNDLVEELPGCTGFDWKPEPKWVPWTFETMPIGVKVKSVLTGIFALASPFGTHGASLTNRSTLSYGQLFKEFAQLDGTPCGVLDEEN